MKWKLWTRNENIMPATTESEQHDSKDAALERACDIIRHQRHVAVLYIEGPDGERIEAADPPPGGARAEGETIRRWSMADIVNFQDRLDKKTKYFERMDLTAKMVPVMVEAVGKMRTMGADRDHVIRFLQATIEELGTSEWPPR